MVLKISIRSLMISLPRARATELFVRMYLPEFGGTVSVQVRKVPAPERLRGARVPAWRLRTIRPVLPRGVIAFDDIGKRVAPGVDVARRIDLPGRAPR